MRCRVAERAELALIPTSSKHAPISQGPLCVDNFGTGPSRTPGPATRLKELDDWTLRIFGGGSPSPGNRVLWQARVDHRGRRDSDLWPALRHHHPSRAEEWTKKNTNRNGCDDVFLNRQDDVVCAVVLICSHAVLKVTNGPESRIIGLHFLLKISRLT